LHRSGFFSPEPAETSPRHYPDGKSLDERVSCSRSNNSPPEPEAGERQRRLGRRWPAAVDDCQAYSARVIGVRHLAKPNDVQTGRLDITGGKGRIIPFHCGVYEVATHGYDVGRIASRGLMTGTGPNGQVLPLDPSGCGENSSWDALTPSQDRACPFRTQDHQNRESLLLEGERRLKTCEVEQVNIEVVVKVACLAAFGIRVTRWTSDAGEAV
jgi:hypothetical protein